MKRILKSFAFTLISLGIIFSSVAQAAEFSDMPDNWTTGALQRAVENGLLQGSDGMIMPDDNITRAQMAAIIVRAFGATVEADISQFPDVSEDKWYYSEFSKAVQMKAFAGTDEGTLNPDNFITYQECFTVVSRVFDLPEADIICLDKFDDVSSVSEWAEVDMAKVVGNGYWEGIENKLKPNDYITRSEFAVLMDNLIKIYINEPGSYTELGDGNVLIRSNDVVIEGITSDDVIYIGDGVTSTTSFLDILSTNTISVRGGTAFITGTVHNVRALCPGVTIDVSGITKRTGMLYGVKDSLINIGQVDLFDI